jgi:hypothetical protein
MSFQRAVEVLGQFKSAVQAKKNAEATSTLEELKVVFLNKILFLNILS